MKPIDIVHKYGIPLRINLKIDKMADGGYFVSFPEYPDLMTEASDWFELMQMVTDAILTYHGVPRKEAEQFDVYYLPPLSLKRSEKEYMNKSVEFHALTNLHSYETTGLWV